MPTTLLSFDALPLAELIPHVKLWHIIDDYRQYHRRFEPTLFNGHCIKPGFTIPDFVAVDPRLKELIEFGQSDDGATTYLQGQYISSALRGWTTRMAELPAEFMPSGCQKQHVTPTFKLEWIDDAQEIKMGGIVLSASFVETSTLPSGALYDHGGTHATIILPKTWVTAHCPDLVQRVHIAKTLGVDKLVYTPTLFDTQPTYQAVPDMSGLSDMTEMGRP